MVGPEARNEIAVAPKMTLVHMHLTGRTSSWLVLLVVQVRRSRTWRHIGPRSTAMA